MAFRVSEDGGIIDRDGGVLYEADCLEGLSSEARVRLAKLHTDYPRLCWEGQIQEDGSLKKGAWDILIEEGLMQKGN